MGWGPKSDEHPLLELKICIVLLNANIIPEREILLIPFYKLEY